MVSNYNDVTPEGHPLPCRTHKMKPSRVSECIKKNFQSLFNKYRLEIIIGCNKKVVDYLDVTFNLKDGIYTPYRKLDNKITYINVQSNHPPNISKQLPKTLELRLSNNSSNETIFNEVAPLYEKALSEAGYDVKLMYNPNKKKQKNRKRNINMVQSTIQQKYGNESWSFHFKIIR